MRAGEVLRLDRDDIDWDQGVLTVWDSKFGKSREVPLHRSALAALRAYAQRRDQLFPDPGTASFSSPRPAALVHDTVQATFPAWSATPGSASGRRGAGPACTT